MEMNWFFLALAATLLWTCGAIINKFLRVKHVKSSIGYLVLVAPVSLYSLVFLFFGPLKIPSTNMLLYIFASSICAFLGYYFYLEAIHKEELSRVTILESTSPLVVLLLATLFLKETLIMRQYLAFPLLIGGSMLISIRKINKKFEFSKGLWFTLVSILFFSLQGILFKLASEVDFVSVTILRQIIFLTLPPALFIFSKKIRKKTIDDFRQLGKKKLPLIYLGDIIGMTGVVLSYLAIQRGSVSLVSLVESTQPFFIFIAIVVITIWFPKILKEKIDKKTIAIKIISIMLMLGGLYLIST